MRNVIIYFLKGLGALSIGTLSLTACTGASKKMDHSLGSPAYYATAIVKPTKGNKVSGEIHFSENFGKVKVVGEISGLQKNLEHGFHIHEFGDCSASDGSSAGGHYNPESHIHGGPGSEQMHAGDLGNIKADSKGKAKIDIILEGISINTGKNPIIGRGIIVHENKDDLVSQPTGGAGKRIACGVIGVSAK